MLSYPIFLFYFQSSVRSTAKNVKPPLHARQHSMKSKNKNRLRLIGYFLIAVILLVGAATSIFLHTARFGSLPTGAQLERISRSPHYVEGEFKNTSPTTLLVGDKSRLQGVWEFLFTDVKDLIPEKPLPSVKTDLNALPLQEDLIVWMGHSSLYLHLDSARILIDPVLVSASPVPGINEAFPGSDIYRPEAIPSIDLLLITHDHWDHLDYETLRALRDRVKAIVCPLGVSAHLISWGYDPKIIRELDWFDASNPLPNMKLTVLPARHFSGRGLTSNKSLWAGYMLQTSFGNILLSGDTGYDAHFKKIKQQFGNIDFAIMENGQYNEDWRYIHMLPEDLVRAIDDLQPNRLMTVHHSKYALARHAWYEPLVKIAEAAKAKQYTLLTPKIGEPLFLHDSTQTFTNWWEKN